MYTLCRTAKYFCIRSSTVKSLRINDEIKKKYEINYHRKFVTRKIPQLSRAPV